MKYKLINSFFPDGIDTSLEKVLYNRGIAPENIDHYLHTTDADNLDPRSIARIDDGIKMLIPHIAHNDTLLVQVDSDCDGYTSAAAFINYLNCRFPGYVQNHVIYRIHEGKEHGVHLEDIPEEVKIVVAPDSSSNDYEVHQQLAERGTDVLVIDHHEADHISEYACVINNQLCDYPTKSLSGVGMVYKFCQRIDQICQGEAYADLFLDLVSLGMIADMMDLRDFETRHLVDEGLERIRNPYFKGMVDCQKYPLKDGITPIGIAFYIAPFINATVRSGTQEEKLILFESMLDYRGYEQIPSTKKGCKGQTETRVEQACRNCKNIKERQTHTRDQSLDVIKRKIENENLLEHKILAIALNEDEAVNPNLAGLIANELASKFQRPTLILNLKKHEDGPDMYEGSGRGYGKSELTDFRQFLLDTGLVDYAQGHANAFGVGINVNFFDQFVKQVDSVLKDFDFSPCYEVDLIYNANNLTGKDILDIAEGHRLWGTEVGEPLIAIERIKVTAESVKLMSRDRNPTLKITLPNGTSLIKFRSSEEEYNTLYTPSGCVTINVIGRPSKNVWNGIVSPQILIEDYEIVGETKYYF